jgi:hypothetical protein
LPEIGAFRKSGNDDSSKYENAFQVLKISKNKECRVNPRGLIHILILNQGIKEKTRLATKPLFIPHYSCCLL